VESLVKAYAGRRVFVTGHTGFKGSWLSEWLLALGAEVHGYALEPPTRPSLFVRLRLSGRIASDVRGDVRDFGALKSAMRRARPDYVFHLAAQPLVRLSYERPFETFETNVMGTVGVLEACRGLGRRCSLVCVTTDKCYENRETTRPYRETDPMGGYDPYSCSKGCDELVVSSYRRSFFGSPASPVWVASARAGNVIGGGDWAKDRLVPDCMRALSRGLPVPVRNKASVRPWQHVLEPLCGYLALGAALDSRTRFEEFSGGFNFGPEPRSCRTVGELVDEILKNRPGRRIDASDPAAAHEASLLSLDIRKARRILGWRPRWNFATTVAKTVEWYSGVAAGEDPGALVRRQISEYGGLA